MLMFSSIVIGFSRVIDGTRMLGFILCSLSWYHYRACKGKPVEYVIGEISPLWNRVRLPLPLWCNVTLAEVAVKQLKQRVLQFSTIETEDERRVLSYFQMQQRLLLPFLCIGVTNGNICCNEAHKARLGKALGQIRN
ncbi:hypothetical protein JHK82_043169 [Glycine max]|nr:hypothetical protein JHK86_043198 [Glycine max]KAG5106199.1 hypothetical protein JHK82_043169 [Glycine max]KAG5117276.1 hypothetical protein JHK84_043389 [Glycine max]